MKYIKVQNSAGLVTNAVNENYPDWNSSKEDYQVDDYVIYAARIYRCRKANEVNRKPSENPLYWSDLGAVNAMKVIDKYVNTQTVSNGVDDLWFELSGNKINAVFIENVEAGSVKIDMYDGVNNLLGTKTVDLMTDNINNWIDYFWGDAFTKISGAFIPLGLDATKVRVTLLGGAITKIGILVAGTLTSIGCTHHGMTLEFNDYSKKTINEDGFVYLKEGKYSFTENIDVRIDNDDLQRVRDELVALRGSAAVFIPIEDLSVTPIYGFLADMATSLDYLESSNYTLTIQGIT